MSNDVSEKGGWGGIVTTKESHPPTISVPTWNLTQSVLFLSSVQHGKDFLFLSVLPRQSYVMQSGDG